MKHFFILLILFSVLGMLFFQQDKSQELLRLEIQAATSFDPHPKVEKIQFELDSDQNCILRRVDSEYQLLLSAGKVINENFYLSLSGIKFGNMLAFEKSSSQNRVPLSLQSFSVSQENLQLILSSPDKSLVSFSKYASQEASQCTVSVSRAPNSSEDLLVAFDCQNLFNEKAKNRGRRFHLSGRTACKIISE